MRDKLGQGPLLRRKRCTQEPIQKAPQSPICLHLGDLPPVRSIAQRRRRLAAARSTRAEAHGPGESQEKQQPSGSEARNRGGRPHPERRVGLQPRGPTRRGNRELRQHKNPEKKASKKRSRERVKKAKADRRKEDAEATQELLQSQPPLSEEPSQKKQKKAKGSSFQKKIRSRLSSEERKRTWPKSRARIGSARLANRLPGFSGFNGERRNWKGMSTATSVTNGPPRPTCRARIMRRQ